MTSRRPFSIQELAARSRPTGYDPSKSLKDLLRIATAERDAGEQAKAANDVETAFIHFAKASTLMLEDLPTHPKFAELTSSQKEAVVVHGQMILDSLGAIKPLVSERFSDWRTRHPDADLSAPAPTSSAPRQPSRRPTTEQRQQQRTSQDTHEEEQRARRARHHQEAQRLVAEQERRQRAQRRDHRDVAAYDQVANITTARNRERADRDRQEKERLEREEILAEKKRAQEAAMNAATAAAFLGYPTPASLHTRVRPESYEGQNPASNQPVSIQPQIQPAAPPPPPSAPPVSIPQAQHFTDHLQRSNSALGYPTRTGSAARVHPSHPPTTQPPTQQPVRAPSRSGSRAEHHPVRPGSRTEQRQMPAPIRTDVFGQRNESAPAAYGAGANVGMGGRQRRPSMSTSPVKERPGFGFGSHPPTTQAPVPRRRTSSHNAPQQQPQPVRPGAGPGPGFPVASAFSGAGMGVGIGVDVGGRPNGGSFDAGGIRPPPNNAFDPRPNGGSFDARAGDMSTRANGVFPDIRAPAAAPSVPQAQMPQDILPLESPSHSWTREPEEVQMPVHAPAPRRNGHHHQPVRGSSYPPPVTTTSPPPGPISYPNLMSSHQREQGYLPSSHSMFSFAGFAQALAAERDAQIFGPMKTTMNTPPSLLFQPNPDPTPPGGRPAPLPNPYGSSNSSPAKPATTYAGPGAGVGGVPTYPGMPQAQAPASSTYRVGPGPGPGPSNYATRPPPAVPAKDYTRAPPPIPPPDAVIPPLPSTANSPSQQPDEQEEGKLRQVLLPEEVIQKFMSIAKPNTLQNRETCGLLLGKKRGPGFAVTTLLIPRQRATSDTCEMTDEVLIMEFQETRGLITLGWIHTHPTQSCFMSSLDLHTHSGYQASLREAFAIVCAPSQSPNVGIFRLTDPPGLQTILKCTAKESFHPHSAANIYTDADQGHVKMMKKLDLSIVDLRRLSH
ncbi:hypothetical protein FRC12_004539 [Ceratobasidium sp. 428]|nr:hypothetical protein FRC12_004539 [Ceratobasidium sp. 428]